MPQFSFGTDQIGKPVPHSIAFWCRVYTIIGACLMTAVKTAPFIDTGSVLEQSIEWFFSTTIAVANLLLPLFGVNVKGSYVPTEDVREIDTTKDK